MYQTKSGIIQLQFFQLKGMQFQYANEEARWRKMYPTSGWENITFQREKSYHAILTSSKIALSRTGESFDVIDTLCTFDTLEDLQRQSKIHYYKIKNITNDEIKLDITLEFALYLSKCMWAQGKKSDINTPLISLIEELIAQRKPDQSLKTSLLEF